MSDADKAVVLNTLCFPSILTREKNPNIPYIKLGEK